MIIELDDASDPRLQRFANLREPSVASTVADAFIAEGRWCVERLIDSSLEITCAVIQRGKHADLAARFSAATPVFSLPAATIRQLVGFDFHRGALACGERAPLRSLDQLRFDPDRPQVALAVLGVAERDNMGSMIRTATALGIRHLLLGPGSIDPWSRRSIRVSMATVFQQHLYRLDQPLMQLAQLQNAGYRTVVSTLNPDATALEDIVIDTRPIILVVGNEAEGVDSAVQDVASERVTIPMQLGTDSLNVSVAAAIMMYQLATRQSRLPRDLAARQGPDGK